MLQCILWYTHKRAKLEDGGKGESRKKKKKQKKEEEEEEGAEVCRSYGDGWSSAFLSI
jgi:hypothetical protein